MHAMVTGGTGFIGSHLVDSLLEKGFDVTCTVRKSSNLRWLQDPRIRRREVAFSDQAALRSALEGVTHVFHVAGIIQAPTLEAYMQGNRDLTRQLVDACRGLPIRRFVHFSSLAVAGPASDLRPRSEADECRPLSKYGKSKLAGELEARRIESEIPLTVVRPPVVYGPRDTGLFEMFQVVHSGVVPMIGARKFYSIVHSDDLIRGTFLAMEGSPGTWFISNQQPVASDELAILIERGLGRPHPHVYVSDGLLHVAADLLAMLGLGRMFNPDKAREITQRAWLCTSAKAEAELGFRATVPLPEGFRRTAEWYQNAGWFR